MISFIKYCLSVNFIWMCVVVYWQPLTLQSLGQAICMSSLVQASWLTKLGRQNSLSSQVFALKKMTKKKKEKDKNNNTVLNYESIIDNQMNLKLKLWIIYIYFHTKHRWGQLDKCICSRYSSWLREFHSPDKLFHSTDMLIK